MSDTEIARRSKVRDVHDAIEQLVPDHSESLWVGGMHMHNVPMALVRECIRQGKCFETLYAGPSSSLAADLLVGAGMVERVLVGYLGFEHLGLAPAFRRAAVSGTPAIVEVDSGSLLLGLQAGAAGQPFAPLPPGLELTSLPTASPDFYKVVADPFGGEEVHAVPAIRPTVALLHCQQADEFGNGIFKGSEFSDRLAAMASSTVLLQVEGTVDDNQILKYPQQTGIPSFLVDAVVPVNFGCHPTSSHRYYNYDDVHLRLYLKAANSEAGFQEYLKSYVTEPDRQEEYMRRVQNQDWSAL
jgi:glutaconate CoA-transferase subunit A